MRRASVGAVLGILFLAGCGDEIKVFSSRTSPSRSSIAENVLIDHGGPADGGTSRFTLRDNRTGHVFNSELNEPKPELFMRWVDETHLEVWSEAACDPSLPEIMGKTHILCRRYVFPSDFSDLYRRSNVPMETIDVPADKVSASFDQKSRGGLKSCVLLIETLEDPAYDAAKVEITVDVNTSCQSKGRSCVGIVTRFGLAERRSKIPQTMLTSATVANIPSYNRLPEGNDGTGIRGQFLENSAVSLIEKLKAPSIEIEYSHNFFERILRYNLPLTAHAEALGKFHSCVGNADLLWTQH